MPNVYSNHDNKMLVLMCMLYQTLYLSVHNDSMEDLGSTWLSVQISFHHIAIGS